MLKQATYDSVHNADVICTTTNSSTPLFDGRWLSSNTHINAIGSYTPAMQELDACTVEQCCIYIDTPHALSCGDLSMANVTKERHGLMTLGQACTMPREQLQRTLGPRERSGGGKGNGHPLCRRFQLSQRLCRVVRFCAAGGGKREASKLVFCQGV